jgi:hypothetical protein
MSLPETATLTVPLLVTDHAAGGERPLPGFADGSSGGDVIPFGVLVPAPDERLVVVPPPVVPGVEPVPVPPGPEIVPLPAPAGDCDEMLCPELDDDVSPGTTVGDCGAEPVVTPPVPTPVLTGGVVLVVTVTSGNGGVVTPTDDELGGGGVEELIVCDADESSGVTAELSGAGPVPLEIVPLSVESGGVTAGCPADDVTELAGGESSRADCRERADCNERDGVVARADCSVRVEPLLSAGMFVACWVKT